MSTGSAKSEHWVRANFLSLFSLLVTLVALGLGIWFFFLQQDSTSLTLQLTSHTNLISPEAKESGKVSVLFEDKEIPELWLATFRLFNDGDVPVRIDDFAEPIKVILSGGEFIEIVVGESTPRDLDARYSLVSNREIHLQPLLLNSGDTTTFSIFATESMDALRVSSRIAGVNEIRWITAGEETDEPSVFLFLSSFVLGVLGTVAILTGFDMIRRAWLAWPFRPPIDNSEK